MERNIWENKGFFSYKVVFVDVDETLCITPEDRNYELSIPIYKMINKINNLYDKGYKIVIWTARGSIELNKKKLYELITLRQLKEWGVKFHEFRMDKPY